MILWRGFRVKVVQIENSWRTPDGPVFRVRLEDGAVIDLQYLEESDEWLLTDHLLPRI